MNDDKTYRRRRGVLALLVVIALVLLTAYFGGSSSGPLHSVQRGIVEALTPVQKGASKVLSPVRDVFGYFSSTIKAKSQNKQLRAEVDALNLKLGQALTAEAENAQLRALMNLDQHYTISSFDPVTASVIAKNSSLWYSQIEISIGSGDGVKQYDPVISGGGLVGYVWQVFTSSSIVRLLSSPDFAVGAMVVQPKLVNYTGVLKPQVGNPLDFTLSLLPMNASISYGADVVCSGFKDGADTAVKSYCPAGIPIGTISTSAATISESLTNSQQLSVSPDADLQHVSIVQVLTDPHPGTATGSSR